MAEATSPIIQTELEHITTQEGKQRFPFWHRLALASILLIAIFMDFYRLGQSGFGTYYPPAVRSMMDNWHNFFFASYDPGGFVTIDKPPVGFWLEVASAKLFGFSTLSILLPQALAGVLSVLLLYYLVRRHFGIVAGLLAALALALSPISIVTNRNETIDSTLALVLLIGAWAVLRAVETGRLRWLLLSAAIVGLGFNIKMLEAYLVVPAFGLLYLLAAPRSIWKRLGHLTLAALLLVVVSFSWAAAVDLTPASQRPYVGSTQDNSEISLALGYNGIDRLFRGFGKPQHTTSSTHNTTNRSTNGASNGFPFAPGNPPPNGTGASSTRGNNPPQPPGGFGGPGGLFATGNAGPLRLFIQPLAGQIAWLLPLAILGMLALAWQRRPRLQSDHQQQALVLWGTWLLTMGIFFSVAGFFHQYYMTEMSPAIAALFGIGIVTMWQDYRRAGWRGWLLPLALLATLAEQIYILNYYPTWRQWMVPFMTVPCAVAVCVLIAARLAPHLKVKAPTPRFLQFAIGVGCLALLIAPTVWGAIPVIQGTQEDLLVAGPIQTNDGFGGRRDNNTNTNAALIRYLEANQGNTKFLVAVPSSNQADSLILATNKPVMALGGFGGSDPILTPGQLASLVSNGTVRFFYLSALQPGQQLPPQILDQIPQQFRNRLRNGFPGFGGQQRALTTWVTQHCKAVPTSQWQAAASDSSPNAGFGPETASQLYDCATTH